MPSPTGWAPGGSPTTTSSDPARQRRPPTSTWTRWWRRRWTPSGPRAAPRPGCPAPRCAPPDTPGGAKPASPAASPPNSPNGESTRPAPSTPPPGSCARCDRCAPNCWATRLRAARRCGGSAPATATSRFSGSRSTDAKAAAKRLGGTINDLFVTGAVNAALAYHHRREAPVEALNISFVVSTRDDRTIGGNAMTPTRLQVPGGAMDPAARYAVISERLAARRAEVRGQGMLSGLAGIANLLPTSLVTSVARAQAGKIDFATSNLRGARSAQYVSGARVLHKLAFGPAAGTAFNLTAFSYNDRFDMALTIDPAAVEEPAELRHHLEDGYAELLQAGGPA